MNAADIIGYTYRAENYTPEGVIEALIANGEASPAARDMGAEAALDQIADANAIDRQDEHSYDSDEFPKVIFADSAEDGETFLDERGRRVDAYGERVYPEGTTYELECGCHAHKTRMRGIWGFYCEAEEQGYCNFECSCDEDEDGSSASHLRTVCKCG